MARSSFRAPSGSGLPTATGGNISRSGSSKGIGISVPINIGGAPAPLTLKLASGAVLSATVGSAYSLSLSSSGGSDKKTYSILTGSLVGTGLTLNSANGSISGTPLAAGNISVTIRVTDGFAKTDLPATIVVS